MNFTRNSNSFFKSRNFKNLINSKYSGNVMNSFLNKMRVKSYLNFSNNFFAMNIAFLNNQILSNISGLKEICSGQEQINAEALSNSSNLTSKLIDAEYSNMLFLIVTGSKFIFFNFL